MARLCLDVTGVTRWKGVQAGLLATRWVRWKIRTGPPSDFWGFMNIWWCTRGKNGLAHLHSLRPALLYPSHLPGDFQAQGS